MPITKVKYVRAADPVGRALIAAASQTWDGVMPDWRENEYARGEVELIDEVVRVIPDPVDENWVDIEEQLDRIRTLVNSVQGGALDEALSELGLLR